MSDKTIFIEHKTAHHATQEQIEEAAKQKGLDPAKLKLVFSQSGNGSEYRPATAEELKYDEEHAAAELDPAGAVASPPEVPEA